MKVIHYGIFWTFYWIKKEGVQKVSITVNGCVTGGVKELVKHRLGGGLLNFTYYIVSQNYR